jgi:ketosteroid isomerase-like protein
MKVGRGDLRMKFRKVQLAGGVLLFATLAAFPAEQAQAPAQRVFDRYVAAAHAADLNAIRTLIADDVVRPDFPACTPAMSNKDCLTLFIDATMVGQHGRLKLLRSEVRGDTVHASVEYRSDLVRKAGVERALGTDIVQVRNGLITAFQFVPDFTDEQTTIFFATRGIVPHTQKP